MTDRPNRTGRSWQLIVHGDRPLTVNKARTLHPMAWAKFTSATRKTWHDLAVAERLPALDRIVVTATPLHADRRSPQDACACAPATKAAIDGLVDAGVIPDDNGKHLLLVVHTPPAVTGQNGLRLLIEELTP